MMLRLQDKVAVVTGGGQGLGAAIVRLFAREGAQVVVADVNLSGATAMAEEIVAAGGRGIAFQVDITQKDETQRLMNATVEEYGRIDVLVNNAGIASSGTVTEIDQPDWDRVMSVNVTGSYLCSKFAIPFMEKQGGGNIVCIASASGVIGQQNQVAYNVSKHAVIGLVRCMALDHASANIRVNAVCPGVIQTPMLNILSDEQLDELRSMSPLQRMAQPEEIAATVLHLASDESSFTTGSACLIDGGYTAK